mgnify:FL=1|jgi:ribonuclease I
MVLGLFSYIYNTFYKPLYSNESRFYYLSLIKTEDKWHIHGLWPQYDKKTYPKCCKTVPFDITKLNSIITSLHNNWYSTKDKDSLFWEHEWNKHGTCMFQPKMNELDYFSKTLELFNKVKDQNIIEIYCNENKNKSMIPFDLNFNISNDV